VSWIEKQCRTCKRWKPLNTECFKRKKLRGWRPECRECRANGIQTTAAQQPGQEAKGNVKLRKDQQEQQEFCKTHGVPYVTDAFEALLALGEVIQL
jgi:hypothetical protein